MHKGPHVGSTWQGVISGRERGKSQLVLRIERGSMGVKGSPGKRGDVSLEYIPTAESQCERRCLIPTV